jgi:hypothetical protein
MFDLLLLTPIVGAIIFISKREAVFTSHIDSTHCVFIKAYFTDNEIFVLLSHNKFLF